MSDTDGIPLRIIVKNVYERNSSIETQMESTNTILDLKLSLQEKLASGALPKQQRLIFGGKICDDGQTLAQVIKRMESNESYTFHLLVNQPIKPPTPQVSVAPARPQAAIPVAAPAPTFPSPTEPQPAPNSTATSPPPIFGASNPNPAMSVNETMNLQHYIAQQELMIQMQIQYIRHIQQYQQIHGVRAPETTPVVPTGFTFQYTAMFHPQGAATAPAPQAPSPRFQAIRAVFGLLDITLALKMCVMVYIIGQDLPPPRSYVLIALASLMYLYMTGILLKIYDIIKGNPHVDRAPPVAAANNGDLFNQENDIPQSPPGPPIVTITTESGVLKDIQSFLVGLLLSLIPSWRPEASGGNDIGTNELPPQPAAVEGN